VDASCRICRNATGNRGFTAREMMLGLRDRFDYLECGRCGALQIREVPADLGRYYAPPYYAFRPARPDTPWRRWLKRRLADHALGQRDPVGALVALATRAARVGGGGGGGGAGGLPGVLQGIRRAGLDRDARILDVGAGAGHTLFTFHDWGFRYLLGVDPYIHGDLRYGNGVVVLRAELHEVDGTFDLVMFHHSFEHVGDPAATLAAARARLSPAGRILIRMPVAGDSWRRYGADWVELDAPRHLHVHTVDSLRHLARSTGLELRETVWETDGFELWGSEQYRRDIPLTDPRSHDVGGRGEVFSRREMRGFERRARKLNRTARAGRASFWLAAARTGSAGGEG
jgi:SAM-dependent methyltransferase